MRRAARSSILQGVKVAALLAACVAALTVLASATAATPAAYRAHVNAICAPYTPTVKTLLRQLDMTEPQAQVLGVTGVSTTPPR